MLLGWVDVVIPEDLRKISVSLGFLKYRYIGCIFPKRYWQSLCLLLFKISINVVDRNKGKRGYACEKDKLNKFDWGDNIIYKSGFIIAGNVCWIN